MERQGTALHRAAAWCAAALFFAAVAVGTRTAFRALTPEPAPEPDQVARVEPELREVEALREESATEEPTSAEPAASVEGSTSRSSAASRRRPLRVPLEEPLEKHPYVVIEGAVVSDTGSYRKRVLMEVEHPGLGSAVTELHFDRLAEDGRTWIAPFKLIKPAGQIYDLHVRVTRGWEYAVEPSVLRVGASASNVVFRLRDGVEHVDLDVFVLGSDGDDVPGALFDLSATPHEFGRSRIPRYPYASRIPHAGAELKRVPVGTALWWFVIAPGHKPARGELVATQGQERLTVRLEPGWGAWLRDLIPPGEHLPGEVWIDGVFVGPTDPSGATYVEANAPPNELKVRVAGRWVLERSSRRVEQLFHHYSSQRGR